MAVKTFNWSNNNSPAWTNNSPFLEGLYSGVKKYESLVPYGPPKPTQETGDVLGENTMKKAYNMPAPTQQAPTTPTTGGANYGGVASLLDQARNQAIGTQTNFRDQNLAMIARQRQQSGMDYNNYRQSANQSYDQAIQSQYGAANLSKQDIDAAMAQYMQQQTGAKSNVIDETAKGMTSTEDALRRNFASRGALDSTFYAKALATGISGIQGEKIKQLSAIDTAISNALANVSSQKQKVDSQLQTALGEIEAKRSQYLTQLQSEYQKGNLTYDQMELQANQSLEAFASEQDIAKINTLANIQSNLANTQANYQSSQQAVYDELAKNYGVDQYSPESLQNVAMAARQIVNQPIGGRDSLYASYIAQGYTSDQANQAIQGVEAFIRSNPQLQQQIATNSTTQKQKLGL